MMGLIGLCWYLSETRVNWDIENSHIRSNQVLSDNIRVYTVEAMIEIISPSEFVDPNTRAM